MMLLETRELRGGYHRNRDIVKGLSFGIDSGEVLSVLGPNGCGKTTLFRLILGLLSPSGGELFIDGRRAEELTPRERAQKIAYIPQNHTPIFPYSVLDVLLMGRASHFSAFSSPGSVDRDIAFGALERLNISHLANEKYTALSGGQRQMVLIARAMCQSARIFIMDEPGANLDYANLELLMSVISGLAQEGYCVVMSTHSPEHPFSIANKALLMKDGEAVSFGPPQTAISSDMLEQVYGIKMDVVTVRDRSGGEHTICLPVRGA